MESVAHRRWGRGQVLRKRYFGLELFVEFDSGIKLWVKSRDLLSRTRATEETAAEVNSDSSPIRMKTIIEALRLGIVPYHEVEQLTCGRTDEIRILKGWLQSGFGTLSLLGSYGSGKTHMARYAAAIALNQGYAVADCQLDPTENPPYKPKLVYKGLISSFRFLESGRPRTFSDFLWKLIDKRPESVSSNEYLKVATRNLLLYRRANEEPEAVLDWISGRNYLPMDHLRLYDSGTAANIYCNILSGIAVAACEVGLRGLLIIIDEVETLTGGWLTSNQLTRSLNLLKGLLMLSNNEESLFSEKTTRSSLSGTSCEGSKTGLLYSGLKKDTKYAYRLPSHIMVLLASTDVANIYEEYCKILKLEPFVWKDMEDVALRIVGAYQKAYSFDFGDSKNHQLMRTLAKIGAQGNIRRFIKSVIECMDYARHFDSRDFERLELYD